MSGSYRPSQVARREANAWRFVVLCEACNWATCTVTYPDAERLGGQHHRQTGHTDSSAADPDLWIVKISWRQFDRSRPVQHELEGGPFKVARRPRRRAG